MKTLPLWAVADARPSNVDKMSKPGEPIVRLVNYTDVYYNQTIHPKMEFMEATASAEHIERFGVRAGDLIITKDSETADDIGIPAIVGEAAPDMVCAYHLSLIRPDTAKVDPKFLYWCLKSSITKAHWYTSAFGVTRFSIQGGAVSRLPIPKIDVDTQKHIASYLDHETREIDIMLSRLNVLAGAVNVRRKSVIQRATQIALDGTRWEAVPTAHLFGNIGSGTTPKGQHYYTDDADGIPWVTTSELRESVIAESYKRVTREAVAEVSSLKIHPAGSVLIAMYGATIGRLGTLGVDAATNQACCAFSDPHGVDARFFYYTLLGQRDDIVRLAVGGGQPNISQTMLRRWRVPCPPPSEQKRIVAYLDQVTLKIDAILVRVAELKSLLLERRAALITDVVTGRKEIA